MRIYGHRRTYLLSEVKMSKDKSLPISYTFRRCPYAMRARMALYKAQIPHEHREVILRDKPAHMLEISPKGTVPVMQLDGGHILEESLDIMMWALEKNDPDGWLEDNPEERAELIARNDGPFKAALDRYKYPDRFEGEDSASARDKGHKVLTDLNIRISDKGYLNGDRLTFSDIAIFPFIRQFAHVDTNWFGSLDLKPLQNWLETQKNSGLFKKVMVKTPQWTPDQDPVIKSF